MSHSDTTYDADALRQLAEQWLKRPLMPVELLQLEAFLRDWQLTRASADAPSPAQAHSREAIHHLLDAMQASGRQALDARRHGDEEVRKVLEATRALQQLGPVAPAAPAAPAHPALGDVANRLADLIKADVQREFQRHLGPLQRQLEATLGALHAHEAHRQIADNEFAVRAASPAAVHVANPAANPAVSPQVTDAVTQSNVKVLAEAPAMAMGSIYQTLAHSTGVLFENAVSTQQQQNTLAQAAANQGVMQIYSIDTTAAAGAVEKVAQAGVADNLTSLLTVLNAFRQ